MSKGLEVGGEEEPLEVEGEEIARIVAGKDHQTVQLIRLPPPKRRAEIHRKIVLQ